MLWRSISIAATRSTAPPFDEPQPGCIVVFWRESPNSWKGHVGFFEAWDASGKIRLLGGNQGGGVDYDEVGIDLFPKERVLGYRWPPPK